MLWQRSTRLSFDCRVHIRLIRLASNERPETARFVVSVPKVPVSGSRNNGRKFSSQQWQRRGVSGESSLEIGCILASFAITKLFALTILFNTKTSAQLVVIFCSRSCCLNLHFWRHLRVWWVGGGEGGLRKRAVCTPCRKSMNTWQGAES